MNRKDTTLLLLLASAGLAALSLFVSFKRSIEIAKEVFQLETSIHTPVFNASALMMVAATVSTSWSNNNPITTTTTSATTISSATKATGTTSTENNAAPSFRNPQSSNIYRDVNLSRANNSWSIPKNTMTTTTSSLVRSVPPYTQSDISRLARVRNQFLLHLLIFDGQRFQLFSVSDRAGMRRLDCTCDTHLIELLIDGLLTTQPNRFRPNQPTFQLLLATVHDNVHFPCVEQHDDDDDEGDDEGSSATIAATTVTTLPTTRSKKNVTKNMTCLEQKYPPLVTPGSTPKNTSTAPFIYAFPTKFYNDCLFHWRHDPSSKQQQQQRQNKGRITTMPLCHLQHLIFPFQDLLISDNDKLLWDTLIPQVYWRGSNLNFVKDISKYRKFRPCQYIIKEYSRNRRGRPLTPIEAVKVILQQNDTIPRCRAVAMTVQAEHEAASTTLSSSSSSSSLPWINVKFTQSLWDQSLEKANLSYLLGNYTTPTQMSQYKYQIDFGGMGGTTWLGTITKLAMPGLLFHHETPTKDWFHDEIRPWEHYVPIHTNLSNLYDMYVWAETHPLEARRIAQRGQEYAFHHVNEAHFQATFDQLYVQQLSRIVDAYQPSTTTTTTTTTATSPENNNKQETLDTILQNYQKDNLFVTYLATCNRVRCNWKNPPYWIQLAKTAARLTADQQGRNNMGRQGNKTTNGSVITQR